MIDAIIFFKALPPLCIEYHIFSLLSTNFVLILVYKSSVRCTLLCITRCFSHVKLLCVSGSFCGFCCSILEKCADGKADLFLLLVDVDDLDFYFLTDLKNVGRLCDLGLGDLRNVDQTVGTGNDLSECAEGRKAYDLNGSNIAYCVLILEYVPGVHVVGLVAEGDLAGLLVEGLDPNVDDVADLNDLRRMLDVLPGQLAVVYHTVNAAEVNECTVGSEVLNGTLIVLALFNGCPECIFLSLALLAEYGTDRSICSVALLVDVDDLYSLGGADERLKIAALRYAAERSGDEYANTGKGDQNPALNSLWSQLSSVSHFITGC